MTGAHDVTIERRSAILLDASAVLAWLQNERGADAVDDVIETSSIGAANWSEVLQKAWQHGGDGEEIRNSLTDVGLDVEPVMPDDGVEAARLWKACPDLSLGDRLCLAMGRRLGYTVWTADASWKGRRTGIMINLIR